MNAGTLQIELLANIARLQKDMDDAKRVVGGAMSSITSAAGIAMKSIMALGAGLSAAALVGMVKGAIDAADNLNDLSKATKIAIGDLAGLKLAAQQSGGDLQGAADAVNKLAVNMGKDAEKFKALGITAKEPLEAFKQLADIFSRIQDPQMRAALGAATLGKSWASAAPMLSEGSKKIGEMISRGKELSGITQEMADQADEFNDKLAELNATMDGFKTKVAADMLPGLNDVAAAMKKAYEESGLLQSAWVGLGALGALAFTDEFASSTVKIKNLRVELAQFEQDLDLSKNAPAVGYLGRLLFGESTEFLEGKVASLRAQIKTLQDAGQVAAPFSDPHGDKVMAAIAERRAKDFLAGEAAAKAREAAIAKEASAYQSLITSIGERLAVGKLEAVGYEKATEAQRMTIKLDQQMAANKNFLSAGHEKEVRAQIAIVAAQDAANLAAANVKKATSELSDERNDAFAAAMAEVAANEALVAAYGKTKAEIEALDLAKMEARLNDRVALELDEKAVAQLERMIAAKRRNASAVGKLESLDTGSDLTRAKELLDVLVQIDEATQSAAASMEQAFGRVGAAIGGLTTTLSGYARTQQAIVAQLASVKATGNASQIAAAEIAASKATAQARVKSYGDMASAAKGFFKENSTGYKVMEGTEKAFRAAEMAMAIESMLEKSGLLASFTSLFVASKATQTTAEVTATGTSVLNAGAQSSAWGVTAVVKALASLPFPANLAAGAATLAAVLAIGAKVMGTIGGGGSSAGGVSAAEMQKKQGTGSVFGASDAKSESILNALELLEENSDRLLPINRGMLQALRSIEASMSGLTNLLVRTPGLLDASNMGIREGVTSKSTGASIASGAAMGAAAGSYFGPIGTIIGGIGGAIIGAVTSLWGKTKQSIIDSGVQFGGSVRDLQQGQGYNQYASVDTTKSSWFGLSKSTSNSIQTQGLSAELSNQFGMIFRNLEGALSSAAVALGVGSEHVTSVLDSLTLEVTSISLKGLSGDDLTQAISGVISKAMDEMSAAVFPQMESFRRVGEGYAETVIRVATNYATLDATLAAMSMTFGAVGLNSIAARERLLAASGGMDAFTESAAFFVDNFLTDAQRMAPIIKSVTDEMAGLGLAGVTTVEGFAAAVIKLQDAGALATTTGAAQFAALMAIAPRFKQMADYLAELNGTVDSATAISDARAALTQSYEAERDAIQSVIDRNADYLNSLRGLKDSLLLGNLSPLTPAQKYEEARRQYMTVSAAARDGDTTAQANYQNAVTAFLSASQVANASDAQYRADFALTQRDLADAMKWAAVEADIAKASLVALDKQVAGLVDVNKNVIGVGVTVSQAINNLAAAMGANAPASIGTNQTASIQSLYQGLLGRDAEQAGLDYWTNLLKNGTSLSTIAGNITQSQEYMAMHGSHANGLGYVPFDNYRANLHEGEAVLTKAENINYRSMGRMDMTPLVDEIKGLRRDVVLLKEENQRLAAAQIGAQFASTDQAANKVVAATSEAVKAPVWNKRSGGELE